MTNKSVIIAGFLASLLLIFLCIFFNAEKYYKELGLASTAATMPTEVVALSETNEEQEEVGDEETNDVETDEMAVNLPIAMNEGDEELKETSSFSYSVENGKRIFSGKLPLLENGDEFKKMISTCSEKTSCQNNVTFLDNDETLSWEKMALSIVTLFSEENVENAKLSIDQEEIKIEGTFLNQAVKEKLTALVVSEYTNKKIFDMTTVKEEPKDSVSALAESADALNNSENNENMKVGNPSQQGEAVLETQERISSLLKNRQINFQKNSGKIRTKGKKVLDEIVLLLDGKKDVLIEVQGHTDAGGKAKVNLAISKMRANGVKRYLVRKGLNADNITAKGFGETTLLLPEAPFNTSNRRVEIHLKRR